ncbi:glutathionylspermidine synthase family protein [Azospirillum sp. sgz301742]
MRRVKATGRVDWRPGLRKYPYGMAASAAGALWREDARYEFSAQQIDLIESVADELHGMVREGLRAVVEDKLLSDLGLRGEAARLVDASWTDYWRPGGINERAGCLVGRLTLAYDGRDSVKLLACNYDMAPGLFAAALVQRNWLEAMAPDADQFNGLHEALIERWEELVHGVPGRARLHFACATPDPMREGELIYLAATAAEAGIETVLLPLQDIGWEDGRFRDQAGEAIAWLAKLYPWEALGSDAFVQRLRSAGMGVLEPAWCWAASNHGLLAVLWHLYPGHANLCRAALDDSALGPVEAVTVRSLFGLDHAATRLGEHGRVVAEAGAVAEPGGWLWLETPPTFEQDGVHAVLDAWIIGDKCLGMMVREAAGPLVGADAAVVPHLFRG